MVRICDVFSDRAYRRVYSEEGAYDAPDGYVVIAKAIDDDGYEDYYLYTRYEDETEPFNFVTCEDADAFVARVICKGCIDAERYWFHYSRRHCYDLPDYVVNWWRPEYN
jgi:hypothetical protein